MRSGLRALAALCSIALSVNTGCTKDPLRSSEVTQENDSAVRAETADASAVPHMHTVSEKDLTPATGSGSSIALTEAALISTAAVFQSAVRSSPSARRDITPFRETPRTVSSL